MISDLNPVSTNSQERDNIHSDKKRLCMKQLLTESPVTLEFVKHGKEMLEKKMRAEQSWRLLTQQLVIIIVFM